MAHGQPKRLVMRSAMARLAAGSPWVTNTVLGCVSARAIQISSSSASAWADRDEIERTWARTGTISPKILTDSAPSRMARPRVPSAWYPTKSTVVSGRGRRCRRWWRMRPPVAIPEAEMMIAGPRRLLRRFDSSVRPTIVRLGGARGSTPFSRRWRVSTSCSRTVSRYAAVASRAIGESR